MLSRSDPSSNVDVIDEISEFNENDWVFLLQRWFLSRKDSDCQAVVHSLSLEELAC